MGGWKTVVAVGLGVALLTLACSHVEAETPTVSQASMPGSTVGPYCRTDGRGGVWLIDEVWSPSGKRLLVHVSRVDGESSELLCLGAKVDSSWTLVSGPSVEVGPKEWCVVGARVPVSVADRWSVRVKGGSGSRKPAMVTTTPKGAGASSRSPTRKPFITRVSRRVTSARKQLCSPKPRVSR